MSSPQTQVKEYDMQSSDFNESQLPQFSPFRLVSTKAEERTSKKGGKYTVYFASVSPCQNPSVKIRVAMFKISLDNIRAILTLNPKAGIQATNTKTEGSTYTKTIYSGVNVAPSPL